MLANDSPSIVICRRGATGVGCDPLRTVVWVSGEHDVATRVHLSTTLDRAARLDDADIVVDLSGVTFMDASTVGVLVMAQERLRRPARSLSLRSPSPRARRLLDVCGLGRLIDTPPIPTGRPMPVPPAAAALGSWVEVPATDRDPDTSPEVRGDTPDRSEDRSADAVPQPAELMAWQQDRRDPW